MNIIVVGGRRVALRRWIIQFHVRRMWAWPVFQPRITTARATPIRYSACRCERAQRIASLTAGAPCIVR